MLTALKRMLVVVVVVAVMRQALLEA